MAVTEPLRLVMRSKGKDTVCGNAERCYVLRAIYERGAPAPVASPGTETLTRQTRLIRPAARGRRNHTGPLALSQWPVSRGRVSGESARWVWQAGARRNGARTVARAGVARGLL